MANTGPGLSYQWFLNGVSMGSTGPSDITVYTTGLYAVLETNSTGCTAMSAAMHVIADTPVAVITTPVSDTFCAGSFLTLYANAGIGLAYQWSFNGVPIAGAVNSFYNATAAGEYEVDVMYPAGCSASDSIRI